MNTIIKKTQIKNVLSDQQISNFTHKLISKCIEICNSCFIYGNTNEAGVYKGDPAFEFEKFFRHQDLKNDEKYKILQSMGITFNERKNEIDLFAISILKKSRFICNKHFINGVYLDEKNEYRTTKNINSQEFIQDLKNKFGEDFISSYGKEIFAEESFYDADIGEKIRERFKIML